MTTTFTQNSTITQIITTTSNVPTTITQNVTGTQSVPTTEVSTYTTTETDFVDAGATVTNFGSMTSTGELAFFCHVIT
jgi:hypothetical protein